MAQKRMYASYDSLQAWMEAKCINGERLREMLKNRGVLLSKGHLSNILKGSRRCSLKLAIELHDLTNGQVSIKAISRWPISEAPTSGAAA